MDKKNDFINYIEKKHSIKKITTPQELTPAQPLDYGKPDNKLDDNFFHTATDLTSEAKHNKTLDDKTVIALRLKTDVQT